MAQVTLVDNTELQKRPFLTVVMSYEEVEAFKYLIGTSSENDRIRISNIDKKQSQILDALWQQIDDCSDI